MAINSGNKMVTSRNYSRGISRTAVNNIFESRTTFSAGKLFPIYCREVYPNTNIGIDCGELVRSITPLGPTMDRSYLDIFFFYVPNRLLWDHWEEFIAGFNKEAWTQDIVYTVPKIKFAKSSEDVDKNAYLHSFLDYLPQACDVVELAIAIDKDGPFDENTITDYYGISALYPRAYVKIWNDWFRDENLQDELELYTGDADEYAEDFAFDLLSSTALPSAAKYHDRFTSCLPAPVKGPDVLIPMNGLQVSGSFSDNFTAGTNLNLSINASVPVGSYAKDDLIPLSMNTSAGSTLIERGKVVANNVSNTIRMLRLATQTELLLARDARGGTRYVESLLSHFGVHNGDARLQRSEYLGSKQIPLQVTQVTNSAQSSDAPLGNVGGQSVTRDNGHYFSKAFSEHGIILGLACVRTSISRSSGIWKQYQRFGRFDFIWPEFKHIGDVPLLTKELECSYDADTSDLVFGYTPYASELRSGMNFNNGLFRYKADGNLSYLTYQEQYLDGRPQLSSDWIKQPSDVVANTLVTQSGPQFYALFEIVEHAVIPVDPTSDPGLMDHF